MTKKVLKRRTLALPNLESWKTITNRQTRRLIALPPNSHVAKPHVFRAPRLVVHPRKPAVHSRTPVAFSADHTPPVHPSLTARERQRYPEHVGHSHHLLLALSQLANTSKLHFGVRLNRRYLCHCEAPLLRRGNPENAYGPTPPARLLRRKCSRESA